MSYSKTYKPSEAEKRLSSLKQQLYGKDLNLKPSAQRSKSDSTYSYDKNLPAKMGSTLTLDHDLNYLKSDLLKILGLAIFGFGIQILVYLTIQSHLLKLAF